MKKPVVLTIIDGLGLNEIKKGNAWAQANTPTLDDLMKNYPNSKLAASGPKVGLPEGQIGNSEVGHLNIGAGQIVYTGLSLIRNAIDNDLFDENIAFNKSINHAKKNNSTIHVMGLLSPGGVHSLEEHLFEILKTLNKKGVKDVTVHAFTDGRDVAPRSCKPSFQKLTKVLNEYGYKLGSIAGRLYAMDRDAMFNKTEISYDALRGVSKNKFNDPLKYVDDEYAKDHKDEFIDVAINEDPSVKFLKDNDSVIFFNFRPDRARQLAHLIVGSKLYKESPKTPVKNIQMTIMMKYEGIKADVAFESMEVKNTIGSTLSKAGLKQLRIAETQKYAHVTFFMDGGEVIEYPGAKQILVESPKVDDFSTIPEMSAKGITDKLIAVLKDYDVVIMNYANPDMVGHTGSLEAAIEAVEFIDKEIKRLKEAVDGIGGVMFITADHGNAELMIDEKGNVITKHTVNDVPFISTDKSIKLTDGALGNISPTILEYLELDIPSSMDHKSLIK